MFLEKSSSREYYGDFEFEFLGKFTEKWKDTFHSKNAGKIFTMRSHVRFDLSDSCLPKFSIYYEVWKRAFEKFLIFNDTLKLFCVEDLLLDKMLGTRDSEFLTNSNFDIRSKTYKSNIPDLEKMLPELNEIIQLLKRDLHSRRLVVCSFDPRKVDDSSRGHLIFQLIVNFGRLDGCMYLISCDAASDLPHVAVLFSLVVIAVGQNVGVPPGELVVFVEQTIVSESALKMAEHLTTVDGSTLKVKFKWQDVCASPLVTSGDGIKSKDLQISKELTDRCGSKHVSSSFDDELQEANMEEAGYLNLLKDIMSEGSLKPNRTGINTRSLTGICMVYNLRNGIIPVLTTKKMFWKGVLEELLWFIKGSTNANELAEKGVHIWDANGSRQFLDNLGFEDREEGDLGPVYGFQWRHFGAKYRGTRENYAGEGIDQLKRVIDSIKVNPFDGVTTVTSWNASDIGQMALPPCPVAFQFYVSDGELSCSMYQRSADMGLGVPFNIASYSLLTHMVAHVTGLRPGEFVHFTGDTHVYENHVGPLSEQVDRKPLAFPRLVFKRRVSSIDDFQAQDFELSGYNAADRVKLEMAL